MGEPIGVVGYPLIGILSSEPKATFGEVSSVAGVNNNYSIVQISAPIQPGDSGAPVLDSIGSVIGVVVSQASLAVIGMTNAVPQNVNFATRGELAQIFLSGHGIQYSLSGHQKHLETEDLAELGQAITVLIICKRE